MTAVARRRSPQHNLGRTREAREELRSFSVALNERRKECGLTLKELSAKTGASYQTLGNIEQGLHWPSMPVYNALCRELGLPTPPLFSA